MLQKLKLYLVIPLLFMVSFAFVNSWAITSAAPADTTSDPATSSNNCKTVDKCDLITQYVNPFINFLSALVGVAVVASIIIGGIQYGSSAGDPQKVAAAKARIRNALLALVTFIFLYALINFLIPGGLL